MKKTGNFAMIIYFTLFLLIFMVGGATALTIVKKNDIKRAEEAAAAPTPTPQPVAEVKPELTGKKITDDKAKELTAEKRAAILDLDYKLKGIQKDVTNGQEVLGVTMKSTTNALTKMHFEEGEFSLISTFEDLPELTDGKYYEAWLVNEAKDEYVSVGKLIFENGEFLAAYVSGNDYTSYLTAMITIESGAQDATRPGQVVLAGKILQI